MSALNEGLIRDVVAEVLSRLDGNGQSVKPTVPSPTAPCGCDQAPASARRFGARGSFGVFQDANAACQAAHDAFL